MTGDGTVVASIPAGAATDAAANRSQRLDQHRQHGHLRQRPADGDDQPGGRPGRPDQRLADHFTVVFSEAVTGFTAIDIDFTGSTVGGDARGHRHRHRDDLHRGGHRHDRRGHRGRLHRRRRRDRRGRQRQRRLDQHRQHRHASTTCAPTVTINQAAGQADPTNAVADHFTVVFSEPVTGFTATDVTLRRQHRRRHLVASVTGIGHDLQRDRHRHDRRRHRGRRIPAGAATDAAATPTPPRPAPTTRVTFDNVAPDGDDQPGGRPGRPDQRLAHHLHGRLQRAGHRLRRRRRRPSPAARRRHLVASVTGIGRRLHRGRHRHDRRRHRGRSIVRPAPRPTRPATPAPPRPAPTTRSRSTTSRRP